MRATTAARRCRRRHQAHPRGDDEILHAGFRHGRHVGQQRRRFVAGHRERAQLAGLDLPERRADRVELRLHLAGDQILARRRRAAIGHMRVRRADLEPEHHGAQMRRGADAAGGERDLAGIGAVERDEFGQRLGRHVGIDHQHVRQARDQRDAGQSRRRLKFSFG